MNTYPLEVETRDSINTRLRHLGWITEAEYPNFQSANWTCVGLLAHESAMEGGVIKRLPDFTLSET